MHASGQFQATNSLPLPRGGSNNLERMQISPPFHLVNQMCDQRNERASARREMGVELKTAVVWDRFFGEDIRVRGDLRRADGDLCVAGTGFG